MYKRLLINVDLKEPKTFEEQVKLIQEKGFQISEQEELKCIEFLKRANYYRVSAYFLPFRKSDGTFFDGISFSRIQRIYEFDSRLRALIFETIEDIELYLRTELAYYNSHKYGSLRYLDSQIYSDKHNAEKFLQKINGCIQENRNTLVVKHHKEKYGGEFPIWVIIEFFSIGMLSYFYSDMKSEDKKNIATTIYKTGAMQLESWLRCLTDLRNRCAHYARIYYWSFTAIPKMPKNYNCQADRKLFTQLLMLSFLYPDHKKWNSKFITTLVALVEEYKTDISLKHIGFPNNWESELKRSK